MYPYSSHDVIILCNSLSDPTYTYPINQIMLKVIKGNIHFFMTTLNSHILNINDISNLSLPFPSQISLSYRSLAGPNI